MRTEKSCLLNSGLLEASIKSPLSGVINTHSNQIGREEYLYRSAYLFNLNDWIDEANALRTFMLRCYQAGREKIRLAGERGLLWAKYVDGMLT
ncbi:unnamed protein product [Brassica oleracea]|uniref:Uncharacterized protein n=1 Tax=Brassica oleracea TaxID=3712 RepID=A0A3P6D996_BRAOL|nr:unnamed protein product [Brassica oleracea]